MRNTKLTNRLRAREVLEAVETGNITSTVVQMAKQKGVRKTLKTHYGFTDEDARRVVAQILHSEEEKAADRLAAADKVFKVLGSYAPEKSINLNVQVNKDEDPKTKALREEYERKLKETLKE